MCNAFLNIKSNFVDEYLGFLIFLKIGSLIKMEIWISVFIQTWFQLLNICLAGVIKEQAQLRLCKLGPGTVLIFGHSGSS